MFGRLQYPLLWKNSLAWYWCCWYWCYWHWCCWYWCCWDSSGRVNQIYFLTMTEKSESSLSFWQIRTNSEQRQSFPAARLWCLPCYACPPKGNYIVSKPYFAVQIIEMSGSFCFTLCALPRGACISRWACITRHNTNILLVLVNVSRYVNVAL